MHIFQFSSFILFFGEYVVDEKVYIKNQLIVSLKIVDQHKIEIKVKKSNVYRPIVYQGWWNIVSHYNDVIIATYL